MKCVSCNYENIPEGSHFCNMCGANLEQPSTAPKNKKRTVIGIIVVLAILVGLGAAYKLYVDKKQTEAAAVEAAARAEYEQTFLIASIKVSGTEILCGMWVELYASVWNDAIDEGDDFNDAIADVYDYMESEGVLDEFSARKEETAGVMRALQNPPDDYRDSYELLVEMYSVASQICQMATDPSGSLMTYNQNKNSQMSEFDSLFDKLQIKIPELTDEAIEREVEEEMD
jgi:hypothetical protein